MGIAYRPEIDGLRAIAVLAVVLYHAGVGGTGFVGVDIFFVISGYLITSLLLQEHAATGRIDLLAFYARRVRRIMPAAAVVVVATLGVTAILLPTTAQVHTANSAVAALLFVSNIFFQITSGGYFDARADEMPLLHLWSLSVEEQFYCLWPALLLFTRSRRSFAILAVASFALAEWWIAQGSDAAFYEMPARFWELAAGGLIAATPARALPRRLPRGMLSWAGVVVVLGACAWSSGAHFPGAGALPAVVGTCLVIGAVHFGERNALLRARPMVGIGLISYSLYLWHWPLLAFYRATTIGEGSVQVRLALCGVAVLLAIASWRYVEQPFRRIRAPKGRTVAMGASISAILALSACGASWHFQHPRYDGPFPEAMRAENDKPESTCHATDTAPASLLCGHRSRLVVWGDSMAYAWMPAFPGATWASRDACPPMVGYLPPSPKPKHLLCRDFNDMVSRLDADTFVLVALWASEPKIDLSATLDRLRNARHVVIIGPTPLLRDDVPHCMRLGKVAECGLSRAEFDAQAKPILATLHAAAAGHPNVVVVDVSDDFCTATVCPAVKDGMPLYWDSHHISTRAARAVIEGDARLAAAVGKD